MEREELKFKLLETPNAVFLNFSDGNVIVADDKGLMAYSTVKTIFFKSEETQVHSTYISSVDDGVTVWIQPSTIKKNLGLGNDTTISGTDKIIRNYYIKPEHYEKIKTFLWQQSINKSWPDD